MRLRLGKQGGTQRVILLTGSTGFYLAVRPFRRYYRLSIRLVPWHYYVGRS